RYIDHDLPRRRDRVVDVAVAEDGAPVDAQGQQTREWAVGGEDVRQGVEINSGVDRSEGRDIENSGLERDIRDRVVQAAFDVVALVGGKHELEQPEVLSLQPPFANLRRSIHEEARAWTVEIDRERISGERDGATAGGGDVVVADGKQRGGHGAVVDRVERARG